MARFRLPASPRSQEITSETDYQNRRAFMRNALNLTTTVALSASPFLTACTSEAAHPAGTYEDFPKATTHPLSTQESLTDYNKIVSYCNFYEFGTDKSDPMRYAHTLQTRPWAVSIEGEVEKPMVIGIEDILQDFPLQEFIYRMRCVEGWSMVIPWIGLQLSTFLKRFQPTSRAKFVHFISLHDPRQMIGQNQPVLDWPYEEGLRIDEAMHPLTILSVGLYGNILLNQNGAPLRLVVPWKYGFKSIKSIVKIRLTEHQPQGSWEKSNPQEYGFYANVNPHVDHPRWSQKRERRIGEFFKRETLMFNGYAEQVADLYKNMDLRKDF